MLRSKIQTAFLVLLASVGSMGRVSAHEGEDHGTPEPVVASPGQTMLSASGSGLAFDAVLKYLPFSTGDKVPLIIYLVSSETNRAIEGATVSASFSDGENSATVNFLPKGDGPSGAYSATVTSTSEQPASWLFDVSAGDDDDLIAIGGFQPTPVFDTPKADVLDDHGGAPSRLAVLISIGSLLVIGAFATGRLTAGKSGNT
ncbi:hypothetical protein BH09SUM1_BH09SUM1_00840 [soil metagenome]